MSARLVRIGRKFFDDHARRDPHPPAIVRETARNVWISLDDPALPELLSDADYYATPGNFDPEYSALIVAARTLLRAVAAAREDEAERLLLDAASDHVLSEYVRIGGARVARGLCSDRIARNLPYARELEAKRIAGGSYDPDGDPFSPGCEAPAPDPVRARAKPVGRRFSVSEWRKATRKRASERQS